LSYMWVRSPGNPHRRTGRISVDNEATDRDGSSPSTGDGEPDTSGCERARPKKAKHA